MIFNIICIVSTITISLSKESKREWTSKEVSQYIKDNYNKDDYFIADPNDYLKKNQKEVITFRLKDLLSEFNIHTHIIVIPQMKKDTSLNEDEFEISNVTITNNTTSESEKFVNAINKNYFKSHRGKESDTMTLFYSVEDVGLCLKPGRNILKIMGEDEVKRLLEIKDIFIQKRQIYPAVDNVLTDFLYNHRSKTFGQSVIGFLNYFGEFLVFIVGGIVYFFLANNNEEKRKVAANGNRNGKENEKKNTKEKKKKN